MRSRHPFAGHLLALLAVLSLLGACASTSSLAIQVTSDLALPSEIDGAVVDVMLAGTVIDHAVVALDASHSLGRPRRLALVPSLAPGTYAIHVALQHAGVTIVERDARAQVSGPSSLTLLMMRSCRGVACPGSADDPSALACLGGRCVPPECDEEHPEACTHRACTTAADCPVSSIACAPSTCTASGTCFAPPDDALCASGEVCSEQRGCIDPTSVGAPLALFPSGLATGSHTRPDVGGPPEDPLRPTLRWTAPTNARSYRIAIDDSCALADFYHCTFPSPEVDAVTTAPEYTPATPLFDASVAPHSRRFFVSIAACASTDGSGSCDYARVRYIDVGRARGDTNDDGAAELVVGAETTPSVYGYITFDGRTFDEGPLVVLAGNPVEIASLGDTNADGLDDFVVGCPADGSAGLVLGGATGLPPVWNDGGQVGAVGDLDGDGYADVAVGAPSVGQVLVRYGGPGGPDAVGATLSSLVGATRFGAAVAGADLDLDGYSDLVVAGDVGGHLSLEVFLAQNYQRGFTPGPAFEDPLAPTTPSPFVVLSGGGDLDGDSFPDVFVGLPTAARAGVLTRTAYGSTMVDTASYAVGGFGAAVATGSLTGDRRWIGVVGAPHRTSMAAPDFGGAVRCDAMPSAIDPMAEVVRFTSAEDCCGGGTLAGAAVSIADLDGDGWNDLVLGTPGASGFHVIGGGPSRATRAVSMPGSGPTLGHALSH